MASCGGNCTSCGGCGRSLELCQPELELLTSLGQVPFQPVVREAGGEMPIYPGREESVSTVLRLLERKGLISLDYDCPLSGYTEYGYCGYPIRGSFALTARGQQVLELLEYQGIENPEL